MLGGGRGGGRVSVRDHLSEFLTPDPAASGGSVSVGHLDLQGLRAIAAIFDFGIRGGACGEAEADAVLVAIDSAIGSRLPLVSVAATGGTRLTEGMRALVGIPRMALGLQRLRAARLPHLFVADSPTTGGVWVALGADADLRAGVAEATVAFSGPRVVQAMTGRPPAPGAGSAESAAAHGLLDTVLSAEEIPTWLGTALGACAPHNSADSTAAGQELRGEVRLRGGDDTVAASVGRRQGHPIVTVKLAAEPGALVSAAGFSLLARAARLADTIDAALVVTIDTLGGDPHEEGVPAAIGEAMHAVLACRAPTVSLVAGAGGSGGALAGAVTDAVVVGPDGWFAALAPAGASAALRRSIDEVVEEMRIAPEQLISDGFADAAYRSGAEQEATAEWLRRLRSLDPGERMRRRLERWSGPLRPPC